MAAELIEAGVDVHEIVPPALRERAVREAPAAGARALAGRALRRRPADGLLHQAREDYEETAPTRTTRRASSTTSARSRARVVAALVREQLKAGREGIRKVSLRAATDEVDVSVIARKEGGGGHRQAAGFSTREVERRADRVHPRRDRGPGRAGPESRRLRLTMRGSALGGVLLVAKPRRRHLSRRRRADPPVADRRGARRSATRARSTRSRPGCCWCWSARRRACSASSWRCRRPTGRVARFGVTSDTGDPTGTSTETGERADEDASRAALPQLDRRDRAARAAHVGGQGRRRAALPQGAGAARSSRPRFAHRADRAPRPAPVRRARAARELEVECSSGTYVRQLVADLGELCGAGRLLRGARAARRSARSGSRRPTRSA